jgi:RNase P/RNase MRP subunit p29
MQKLRDDHASELIAIRDQHAHEIGAAHRWIADLQQQLVGVTGRVVA